MDESEASTEWIFDCNFTSGGFQLNISEVGIFFNLEVISDRKTVPEKNTPYHNPDGDRIPVFSPLLILLALNATAFIHSATTLV